jgi:signal recognition particle subunit SRP54
MAGKLEAAGMDDSLVKKQEAIIQSMTIKERAKPDLMNGSRKKRIAAGSGTTVQEINSLIKQQKQMQVMMKRMRKMGKGQMMGMMKDMMGGKADDLELMAQSMDPDALGADMQALEDQGALGPNPFASAGPPLGGLGGPALPGLEGAGMPPVRGGTKKNRKKKGKRK